MNAEIITTISSLLTLLGCGWVVFDKLDKKIDATSTSIRNEAKAAHDAIGERIGGVETHLGERIGGLETRLQSVESKTDKLTGYVRGWLKQDFPE